MSGGTSFQFPPHKQPRTWFITAATSPIGLAVTKQLIEHGDSVVAGLQSNDFDGDEAQHEEFEAFVDEMWRRNEAQNRVQVMHFDSK